MPEYTYTFYEARTGVKLGSLPLYGVSASDVLAGGQTTNTIAGTFTGAIRMDSDFTTPQEILDITRPECTTVWMDRDGIPFWAGILWTRTYQSDGRVLQFQAQTFPSYFSKVVWYPTRGTLASVPKYSFQANPYNHVRLMWEYLANYASEEYNLARVVLEDSHFDSDAVTSPELWPTFQYNIPDRKFLSEYVDNAVKAGCEFRMRPTIDNGERVVVYESGLTGTLGVPSAAADDGEVFQYPTDIAKYWLTDSITSAPSRVFGIGKSNGADDIFSRIDISDKNRLGIDEVISFDTSDPVVLTRQTQGALDAGQQQLQRPVYDLANESVNVSWNVGDYRRIIIDDPLRFSTPVSGVVRLVGYQLSPAGSDTVETQSITIDNATSLVPVNV